MSSSTVQNWGPPDPKFIVIVDEKTGEEIGRCGGFEWDRVTDDNGTAALGATFEYDHKTKIGKVKGPVKKIGMAQEWVGSMSQAQTQEIQRLQTELQVATLGLHEQEGELDSLRSKLAAVIRMLGGAVSITDGELADAEGYVHEEAWSPENGTILTIVEKA